MGKRLKRVGGAISKGAKKTTRPVRNNRVWMFLRRTILRSPFRGYFISSWRELRQVKWPDRKTSVKLTLTVILFSAFFAVFTTSLDYGLEKLAKQIFLK